jgi:hypothetical protein
MSTATSMSSLPVEHGRHFLGDRALEQPNAGPHQSLGGPLPKVRHI